MCSHYFFFLTFLYFFFFPNTFLHPFFLPSTHTHIDPLRPELIESTYMMHEYTSNGRRSRGVSDSWLWAGKEMVASLNRTSVKCGYASVSDVGTGKLLDSMVSIQSEGASIANGAL